MIKQKNNKIQIDLRGKSRKEIINFITQLLKAKCQLQEAGIDLKVYKYTNQDMKKCGK